MERVSSGMRGLGCTSHESQDARDISCVEIKFDFPLNSIQNFSTLLRHLLRKDSLTNPSRTDSQAPASQLRLLVHPIPSQVSQHIQPLSSSLSKITTSTYLQMGRQLNLDIRAHRQLIHRNTSPTRLRLLGEKGIVHLIHSSEVLHISQKDINLNGIIDTASGCFEDFREVGECLFLYRVSEAVGG
jgi:hypothetical protein